LKQAWTPSNTILFLIFHSSQAAIRKISMKKGKLANCLLRSIRLWISPSLTQLIPILSQHILAKEQSKKRWSIVSSRPSLQSTHKLSGCTLKCLLTNIFFVFNLSNKISHAKNLTLGVTLDLQTQRNTAGVWTSRKANL
jgi:hypothetical protein